MGRDAEERVRQYFRVKAEQLRAASALPSAEHSGLAGSHREELQRIYLSEILPQRYRIGRGMVYGVMHRSREADIVIWDALNYPSPRRCSAISKMLWAALDPCADRGRLD